MAASVSMRPQQTIIFPGADHRLQVTASFCALGYLTRLIHGAGIGNIIAAGVTANAIKIKHQAIESGYLHT